ncbi:MAG: imidazole glycerol phosphate synthase subunit HisF [Alphaproteobacteria bacterium]|nr:imidazole glycerol phosphate synthase subunit HisF [Alphaproteobacteria bacterium]
MPANRLIPSLLLREGRLVKGRAFAEHRDAGNPATTARAHNAQGADEIIVLDIDASRDRRPPDLDTVAVVAAETQIPLTVGGGVDSVDMARACLGAGADKICLTSTARQRPELISEIARLCGRQAVVLGIDIETGADGSRKLYDHRTGSADGATDWRHWLAEGVTRGAGEIRLMAVDREGTRTGFDTALFHDARAYVNVPIILEGGAGTLDQLTDAMEAGVDSLALGTMLVFSDNNIVKLKRVLANAGQPMRP